MKKILSILFICICALVSGAFALSFGSKVASAEVLETDTDVFNSFKITQEGYVFSSSDFERKDNEYYLYVNTLVTINISQNADPNTTLIVRWTPAQHQEIRNELKNDGITYCAVPMYGAGKIYISIEKQTNNHVDGQFNFYLVQTPVHFDQATDFYWTNNNNSQIAPPTNKNEIYQENLKLNGITGTADCPVFVEFYYNGQFYKLYTDNADGKFYNVLTGEQIYNANETATGELDYLNFNIPGEYEVIVYDKTCYSMLVDVIDGDRSYKKFDRNRISDPNSNYANFQLYEFIVYSPNSYYVLAHDEQGHAIVSDTILNQSVSLRFVNVQRNFAQNIGRIDIEVSHNKLNGEVTRTIYSITPRTFDDIDSQELNFVEDNRYTIKFYNKNGAEISANAFNFQILKNIHQNINGVSSNDPNLVPNANEPVTLNYTKTIEYSYPGFVEKVDGVGGSDTRVRPIESYDVISYNLQLARSQYSIDGIAEGASTSNPVELSVHGVGTLSITVYKDGKVVQSYTRKNGDKLDTISEIGSYSVRLVDEMGNVTYRSFKITKAINTATIVLIIVAVATVVVVLAIIIILRRRIKVK